MMKRLFSRFNSTASKDVVTRNNPMMEQVEERLLMAAGPRVKTVFADNRGQILITMDRALQGSTVNKDSVQIFQIAKDGTETKKQIQVIYAKKQRQIAAVTRLKANSVYKIKLVSRLIKGLDGAKLDGEFKGGTKLSGNGEEGGDYVAKTKKASKSIARFYTSKGLMDVELFGRVTPITVKNFFSYANRARWDGTYFHRGTDANDGLTVIQGGGFFIANNRIDNPVPTDQPISNEPFVGRPRNVRGTIAMARSSQVNSATSQWYFNVTDNSAVLDDQNGGFTVFGKLINNSSLKVMDAISALPDVDVDPTNPNDPFGEVPSDNGNAVVVSRIAIKMDLVSARTNKAAVQKTGEAVALSAPTAAATFSTARVADDGGVWADEESEDDASIL